MKINNYLIVALLFAGCAGSPTATTETDVDTTAEPDNKFVTVNLEPDAEELKGAWKAEDLAYPLLEKKGYLTNIMRLYFEDDNVLGFENMPDMVWQKNGQPLDSTLRSGYGTWKLHKKNAQWQAKLSFTEAPEVNLVLYRDNGTLLLYIPVGNSDSAEGIFFRRTSPSDFSGGTY